ncbi:MAG: YiiD C-terminal domain-containing protein [Pseudoxanthomonas sp.]
MRESSQMQVESMNTGACALDQLRAVTCALLPLAAIQARIVGADDQRLWMEAPLAANLNDKGSAFGGSMTSLMTYSGWALVALQLRQAGVRADVFVADSSVRYLKPLYADLRAEARLAPGQSWEIFLATLAQRGRARIHVRARMTLPEGDVMADLAGRYVAIANG